MLSLSLEADESGSTAEGFSSLKELEEAFAAESERRIRKSFVSGSSSPSSSIRPLLPPRIRAEVRVLVSELFDGAAGEWEPESEAAFQAGLSRLRAVGGSDTGLREALLCAAGPLLRAAAVQTRDWHLLDFESLARATAKRRWGRTRPVLFHSRSDRTPEEVYSRCKDSRRSDTTAEEEEQGHTPRTLSTHTPTTTRRNNRFAIRRRDTDWPLHHQYSGLETTSDSSLDNDREDDAGRSDKTCCFHTTTTATSTEDEHAAAEEEETSPNNSRWKSSFARSWVELAPSKVRREAVKERRRFEKAVSREWERRLDLPPHWASSTTQ
eukprot:Protomagalhaensia_wolfi_Nauph_80__214@NODE_1116_length_1722_cov_48_314320_g850_i0_p1_GENE_NODE_1116_length_1722_cov_48_314320_g850_i0NODE_1116_length_1722_cov_48_314320_g850_i0_p1_ORF_typecomplete_len324_score49_93_NODE_1116_length_1722_cov_48_314320_g850_i04841455